MSFLEESWEEREEKLYKKIFVDTGPGIFPIPNEIFDRMNAKGIDPRWLTHGVFKCPPTNNRSTWAYVTSGMSNPWETEEPEEYSGLGVEFLIETENEEMWAVEVLQTLMAYNLLLVTGQMGDFPPLDYGHRVPLALSDSIKTMMFTQPASFPSNFYIKSGAVDLLQVVGITPSELDAAKQTSSDEIREKLVSNIGGLITSKERASVV
ncbi:suppressor of fused domain protein [Microbulbifer sp. OS29]|uniref:Suppressor of fused domain protein n=1 Tax=Microbulbifer okhotskensis TaxID=2926617 RepID=A0A9X2EWT1_9GAMM|nr:suppressor of fused domain protein [Microbulbifer okhotskensis]MCO1336783.1 suppressor of fused domain protein [Microbulbifer okhotskensis]